MKEVLMSEWLVSGERDEEHQFGITIPIRGWAIDADYFRTGLKNLFDHDALGNSNIFFPLTIDRGQMRGFEVAARSPQLFRRGQFYLAYSNQRLQESDRLYDRNCGNRLYRRCRAADW